MSLERDPKSLFDIEMLLYHQDKTLEGFCTELFAKEEDRQGDEDEYPDRRL